MKEFSYQNTTENFFCDETNLKSWAKILSAASEMVRWRTDYRVGVG